MPVEANDLMWAAHDCNWVLAALILEDFILKGCNAKAIQKLLVRSPSKQVCDGMLSPSSDGLRPWEDCFKVPHTTVLHMGYLWVHVAALGRHPQLLQRPAGYPVSVPRGFSFGSAPACVKQSVRGETNARYLTSVGRAVQVTGG